MLSWFKFVEKYAQERGILYDTALDSAECIHAYKIEQDECRRKHRARVDAMSSNVQRNMNEMRKEMHRIRVLAMKNKMEVLSLDRSSTEIEISELLEKEEPGSCPIIESVPESTKYPIPIEYSRPIPQQRVRPTPKRKVSMFFTSSITK